MSKTRSISKRRTTSKATQPLISLRRWERDQDSNVYYAVLSFVNLKGKVSSLRLERSALANPTAIMHALLDSGLDLRGTPSKVVRQQVNALLDGTTMVRSISSRSGWHNSKFLLPGRSDSNPVRLVRRADELPIIYDRHHGTPAAHFAKRLAKIMKSSDLVTFTVCLALAAPLMSLAELPESFAVHLHSETSTGKTTLLRLMRAIYGANDEPLPTWDQTPRRLEEYAATCRDLPCLIDESVGAAGAKHLEELVARAVFGVASGRGRGRSKAVENALLPAQAMRTIVVSTGNQHLSLPSTSKDVAAGDTVRLFNIAVPGPSAGGVIDGGSAAPGAIPTDDARRLFSRLEELIERHGGGMGDRWVTALEHNFDTARTRTRRLISKFVDDMGELETAELRVVRKFGLVAAAGVLAARHLSFGWSEQRILKACQRIARQLLDDRREKHPSDRQLLNRLLGATRNPDLFEKLDEGELPAGEETAVGFVRMTRGQRLAGVRLEQLGAVVGTHTRRGYITALLAKHNVLAEPKHAPTRQIQTKDGARRRYLLLKVRRLRKVVED